MLGNLFLKVPPFKERKSQVILRPHSITKNEPEKQIMFIKKQFPYPCFDKDAHESDLKLLQLNKKATINKNVAILCLPENGDDVKPGTQCRVAGWGEFHNKSPVSDILREGHITVLEKSAMTKSTITIIL
ncbi:hypothetical protein MC885_005076 [Smutsia gigantea]|nr:hypothetical protein MC885_005076 [Smutsia gigantea]